MLMKSTIKAFVAISALSLALACGSIKSKKGNGDSADAEATTEQVAESISLTHTIEYEEKDVNVLFIAENTTSVIANSNVALRDHLYEQTGGIERGYVVAANEAINHGRVKTVAFARTSNADSAVLGDFVDDGSGGGFVIKPNSSAAIDDIADRAARAHGSGTDNNTSRFRPMTALRQAVTKAKGNGNNKGWLTKDAMAVFVFVTWMDEVGAGDFSEASTSKFLDKEIGDDMWAVAGLTVPPGACEIQDENSNPIHANDVVSSDPTNHVRREVVWNFAEAKTQSICDFAKIPEFFKDVFRSVAKRQWYSIELEVEPNPGTIEVRSSDEVYKDWRYREGKVLEIKVGNGFASAGDDLVISYKSKALKTVASGGGDNASDSVEGPSAGEAEPAALAFIENNAGTGISPQAALQGANCTGCHGQYNTFDGTTGNCNNVLARIDPGNTTNPMPPAGEPAITAEQRTTIQEYCLAHGN